MGLDLYLLPFDCDHNSIHFSHTILNCDKIYDLFDEIQEIEKKQGFDIPSDFTSYLCRDDKYEESHYGKTLDTPYGDPLKYIIVRDLIKIKNHPRNFESTKNKAIWAYLEQLPIETKVALYWR